MKLSGFSGQWDTTWRRRTPMGLVALLVPIAFATGAWHQAAATAAFQPTFEQVPCPEGPVAPPPSLAAEEGSVLSCGYLTVLENRALPNGRTIRLFVTRAEPLEGDPPPDPVFVVGRDLGWAHQVALGRVLGIRAGRTAISMDPRGQGFSEPSLACPEVQRLTAPSTGITEGSKP